MKAGGDPRENGVSRHRTQRPGRPHEGKVAVLQSNRRWACDITTFKL
jgi:hypothetical protein